MIDENGKNLNEIHMEQMIHRAFDEYRDYDTTKIVDACMKKLKERLKRLNILRTLSTICKFLLI